MKKLLFFLLILTSFLSCKSQSNIDKILSKGAGTLNEKDIKFLIKQNYIPNTDPAIIGTYLIDIAVKNNTKNWTVRQLLDSVKAKIKRTDNGIGAEYNYGKDSVFIRDPNGNKMFVGMGQLSFEKLIVAKSLNLPKNYIGDLDLKINSTAAIKTLGFLVSSGEFPVITGNVLIFKRDNGELTNMKIGDIFEISKRIASSKEFAPFLKLVE